MGTHVWGGGFDGDMSHLRRPDSEPFDGPDPDRSPTMAGVPTFRPRLPTRPRSSRSAGASTSTSGAQRRPPRAAVMARSRRLSSTLDARDRAAEARPLAPARSRRSFSRSTQPTRGRPATMAGASRRSHAATRARAWRFARSRPPDTLLEATSRFAPDGPRRGRRPGSRAPYDCRGCGRPTRRGASAWRGCAPSRRLRSLRSSVPVFGAEAQRRAAETSIAFATVYAICARSLDRPSHMRRGGVMVGATVHRIRIGGERCRSVLAQTAAGRRAR